MELVLDEQQLKATIGTPVLLFDGGGLSMVRKGVLSSLVGAVGMLILASCVSEEELRFCARENRTIPDAELKGRLLINVRNNRSNWGVLPNYMEAYISDNLSADATDEQLQAALARYAAQNPLCCQFIGRSKTIERMYEGKMPYDHDSTSYFADFVVFDNEKEFHRYGDRKKNKGRWIAKSAAFSCGEAFVYDFG